MNARGERYVRVCRSPRPIQDGVLSPPAAFQAVAVRPEDLF